MKMLSSLLRNEKGSVTIELALVAPVLATLTIGVVDLSGAYSRKLEIEQGAQRAIEKVMQTTTNTTVGSTIKSEAALAAKVSLNQVSLIYALWCDGDKTAYDSACPAGEYETRAMTLIIEEEYEPVIDPSFIGIGNEDGKLPITVKVGMRTK